MKQALPLVITFVAGIVVILSTFFPAFTSMGEDFSIFFEVIAGFAFFLGGANLMKVHAEKILKQVPGFAYSIVTLIGFFGMLAAGLFKIGNPDGITADINKGGLFPAIYDFAFQPLGATMFALLGFYVASASFRAFRAKNTEATILLGAAMVVLLGRTFIGTWLTDWLPESLAFLKIDNLVNWLMAVPNMAGQRALTIGIALGTIATSLKIIIGLERSHLGGD